MLDCLILFSFVIILEMDRTSCFRFVFSDFKYEFSANRVGMFI